METLLIIASFHRMYENIVGAHALGNDTKDGKSGNALLQPLQRMQI